ncbi:DNA-directed RNA polymerase subunit E'' [Candidatus Woesearchaeota archaeon]|nr:DNA-directed RNA polymerase subunit E'' [Candidatus Woesearchaeota archaeon]MBT4150663.1 DNA-directed RNA polymerase subunit E'' [Candidatus Woesearchaeota archaeon]MBT4247881.1 DNA-directed RNA polymerase subunit E'' [Candidatus Woesearchaeota archaeon]MBT4434305.1 DNA-directed RNA polymerase subunit E'' [Candidatus Woesearchaeota archaeon]MBT7331763.1 DNA-directed RNA polymerase subunit E'' [Candidatus Woesearchaeota archaeon]
MAKKKACKKCKVFVDGEQCPICKNSSFTNNWQGRLFITDVERSMIAQNVKATVKGEYAIKVR